FVREVPPDSLTSLEQAVVEHVEHELDMHGVNIGIPEVKRLRTTYPAADLVFVEVGDEGDPAMVGIGLRKTDPHTDRLTITVSGSGLTTVHHHEGGAIVEVDGWVLDAGTTPAGGLLVPVYEAGPNGVVGEGQEPVAMAYDANIGGPSAH